MNYTSLVTLSTSQSMKCILEVIIDELQKYQYAYIYDASITRWIARATMELRQAGLLILSSPHSADRQSCHNKSLNSIISIPHDCTLIRGGPYKFIISPKNEESLHYMGNI